MADPIAAIIRFSGDPDDLFERFERARRLWIEAQDGDYSRPAFYAACKTDEGIVIVNGWETDAAPQGVRPPDWPSSPGGRDEEARSRPRASADREAGLGLRLRI
jgi:hypothetical protein